MDTVLVVDDEKSIRSLLSRVLAREGREIATASTAREGLQIADELGPDLVLLDLRLPDVDGMQVLRDLRSRSSSTAVIIITAFGQIESAVEAMKSGATDYLEKPFTSLDRLRLTVDRALAEVKTRQEIQRLHQLEEGKYRAERLIGESATTRRLRELISQLAQSEAHTILIQGESGTGKELVARGLHHEGPRRDQPLIDFNCAAIPETLFESELFGHEKGAFTDARAQKKGLMELADRGTLFLDEVSEIAPGMQAKFLRAVQERAFKRVGGTRDIKVDVRIIAATNRALDELVREGKFREDLFYRLNVIPITVAPLRERREDILPLARHFLADSNRVFHKTIQGFSPEAEQLLLGYTWPGNVRELKNLIERVVILANSEIVEAQHLPPQFGMAPETTSSPIPRKLRTLSEVERDYIQEVLRAVDDNKSKAAKILGISRHTLRKKLAEV